MKFVQLQQHAALDAVDLHDLRALVLVAPIPAVAKPECGQQVQRRGLRAAIARRDVDQDVFGGGFGVFDENVEVAIFVENAGVD